MDLRSHPRSLIVFFTLRQAARALLRRPGYSLAAVLTLGIAIGATTAVFSMVKGILLNALPYAEQNRLVLPYEVSRQGAARALSYPSFRDYQSGSEDVFESMGYAYGRSQPFSTEQGPVRVLAAFVSEGFFATLATPSLKGRVLAGHHSDDGTTAVVSYDFWQRRMGGTDTAVGKSLQLGGRSVMVVGIMPPTFRFPSWADVWMPLGALSEAGRTALEQRDRHADAVAIGRLHPGVSKDRARLVLTTLAERQAEAFPDVGTGWTLMRLDRMTELILGDAPRRLAVFSVAVLLAFVLALVNVASLTLTRASQRARELAVRVALGGSRARVTLPLFAESVILALGGALVGGYLALAGVQYLRSHAPTVLPRMDEVGMDLGVLSFVGAVSLAAALVIGVLPALSVTRQDPASVLKSGGTPGSVGRRESRLRHAFMGMEVAIALTLTVTTGMVLKSVAKLEAIDPGFAWEDLVTVQIDPPERYREPDDLVALYQRLQTAVSELPVVDAVALSNHLPVRGSWMPTRIAVDGRAPDPSSDQALFRTVSPEYTEVMAIPVIRGRGFEPTDLYDAPGFLVNEVLADRYWADRDPIGQRLEVAKAVQGREDFGETVQGPVIGVVGDVLHMGLDQPPVAEVYLMYTESPPTWISMVVRTSRPYGSLVPELRQHLLAVEPELPTEGAFALYAD
ncbi:MAG: FtsX-like permease family protein, partial [Gemmatimonadales bacterium]